MDLKQLRFFVATVDAGSISYASRLLHITQPALSRQLSNLEYDLKVELLSRTSSGVAPTEQGKKLYAMAQGLLRDFNQIADSLAETDEENSGKVALGCMDSAANILALPLLTALREKHPKLQLTLYADQSTNIYSKLVSNSLDLGVVCNNPDIEGLESGFIFREELKVALAGASLERVPEPEISPQQASTLPFVFPPSRFYTSEGATWESLSRLAVKSIAGNLFEELHIKPEIVAETNAISLVKKLVKGGAFCAVMPWSAVHEEVELGEIALKTITGHRMFRDVYFCWPQSRPMTKATTMVHAMLTEVIRNLVESGTWRDVSLEPSE